MDDDDMRRNQLSNHKKFDEATAILSGDALLTKAFEHVVDSEYSDHVKLSIIKELSYACGLSGMILGQSMDMNPSVINTNNDILKMYTLKTGMLFGAACAIGAILCDLGDRVDNYRSLGQALGVAFQVQDDLLEDEKTAEELGKSKSDTKNKKINLVTLSGKEEAMYIAKNAFEDSLESLKTYQDHKHVVALITKIQNRGH
jgi:geranylgeranyl diphosphate synthase type II